MMTSEGAWANWVGMDVVQASSAGSEGTRAVNWNGFGHESA